MIIKQLTTPRGPAIMLTTTDESEIRTLEVFAQFDQPLTADIISDPKNSRQHILIRRPKPWS